MANIIRLQDRITAVSNFPQKDVVFRDITPLLLDPVYFSETIRQMAEQVKSFSIDVVAGIESRGFIFASALAYKLEKPFLPIRKVNKLLPGETLEEMYNLEYGKDGVKIQQNAIEPGQNVLIVDDLVATGGSALASVRLVERLHATVSALLFLTELTSLNAREKLNDYHVISLIQY